MARYLTLKGVAAEKLWDRGHRVDFQGQIYRIGNFQVLYRLEKYMTETVEIRTGKPERTSRLLFSRWGIGSAGQLASRAEETSARRGILL